MTLTPPEKRFIAEFNQTASEAHATALEKGWWKKKRNDAETICLMHCELSEAVEGLRAVADARRHADDEIPEFSAVEAELADCIIRIMDMAAGRNLRVGEAIVAKMAMNRSREKMHGGKKF